MANVEVMRQRYDMIWWWLLSSGLWYFLSGTASSVACSSCVYGKILEICRGEQFAPLSHISPVFRLDPFIQFFLSISFNISVILLILMYLLLKRQYIRKLEILECQKIGWSFAFEEVLLPKHISISSAVLPNDVQENYHCHPTPARSLWCVCFTKDGSDCISLLKVDYSMSCLSPGNGVYRKLVAACAIFPFLSFLYCFLLLFTSTVSFVSMMKFVLVL